MSGLRVLGWACLGGRGEGGGEGGLEGDALQAEDPTIC